jgi:hypothetical protein
MSEEKSKSSMTQVNEMRASLSAVFDDLREGKIKPSEAQALANLAGKVLSSAKVQVDYYTMRKETPTIKFLEESSS